MKNSKSILIQTFKSITIFLGLISTIASSHASPGFSVSDNFGYQPAPRTLYTIPIATQVNTTNLAILAEVNAGIQDLGVMPGTSPSATLLKNGALVIAFQANNGYLYTAGTQGVRNWGAGMMEGTSPSITLTANGYQIAFQANTGNLFIVGDRGPGDTRLGMRRGTSPSITTLYNGTTVTAFQANTGNLLTYGASGVRDWNAGMMTDTSPSITAIGNQNQFQIAFQANTGDLFIVGDGAPGSTGLGMMHGTSPSITTLVNGQTITAFQANTGNLYTTGYGGVRDWQLGMKVGTSPSISTIAIAGTVTSVVGFPWDAYQIAIQSNVGNLYTTGSFSQGGLDHGMAPNSSPAIVPMVFWIVPQERPKPVTVNVGPYPVWSW